MALKSGSDCVFNLCSFAPFCIPQDLMKQGQDAPIINLHFKQYQAIKFLDIFQLHQACILLDQVIFYMLQICKKSSIKHRINFSSVFSS